MSVVETCGCASKQNSFARPMLRRVAQLEQRHWLFECGSRGLNVGYVTTLQQTVRNIAVLLQFGIENCKSASV